MEIILLGNQASFMEKMLPEMNLEGKYIFHQREGVR